MLLKLLRRWKNLLLKFLIKTAQRDGYLEPIPKTSRWAKTAKSSAVGRPPGRPTNGQIFGRCATDRSPGRPRLDPESRALWLVDHPVDWGQIQRAKLFGRSTGPEANTAVHACAHRSTVLVDRSLVRSTGSVDRQSVWLGFLG